MANIKISDLPFKAVADNSDLAHIASEETGLDHKVPMSVLRDPANIKFTPGAGISARDLKGALDEAIESGPISAGAGYFKRSGIRKFWVGPSEDATFSTLSEALNYSANLVNVNNRPQRPSATFGGPFEPLVTIILDEGYVWDEPIVLDGAADLSHVYLTTPGDREIPVSENLSDPLMVIKNKSQSPTLALRLDMTEYTYTGYAFLVSGKQSILNLGPHINTQTLSEYLAELPVAMASGKGIFAHSCSGTLVGVLNDGCVLYSSVISVENSRRTDYVVNPPLEPYYCIECDGCESVIDVIAGDVILPESMGIKGVALRGALISDNSFVLANSILLEPMPGHSDGLVVGGRSEVVLNRSLTAKDFVNGRGLHVKDGSRVHMKSNGGLISGNLFNILVEDGSFAHLNLEDASRSIEGSVLAKGHSNIELNVGPQASRSLNVGSNGGEHCVLADEGSTIVIGYQVFGRVQGGFLTTTGISNITEVETTVTAKGSTNPGFTVKGFSTIIKRGSFEGTNSVSAIAGQPNPATPNQRSINGLIIEYRY